MKVLVTGGSGFVGTHLVQSCIRSGEQVLDLSLDGGNDVHAQRIRGDLRDPAVSVAAVRDAHPDRVYHLAAQASLAESWNAPLASIEGNFVSTVNLLEAVRTQAPEARVLVVSTGAVYGRSSISPVSEEAAISPQSPYAAGKAACEVVAAYYADVHGMHILRIRAFNHAGPGQSDEYVVSAFARQIAAAERAGATSLLLRTGDLRPQRDFTDVRDIVRAYRMAMELAQPATYNVCSGRGTTVAQIVEGFASHTQITVETAVDPSLLRENEVFEIRGSNDRLTAATGWAPEIALATTLADTLDWWRANGDG